MRIESQRFLFCVIAIVTLAVGFANAQPPERGSYSCALATSADAAIEAGTAGTENLSLLIGDGIFRLVGGKIKIGGQIAGQGAVDATITRQAGTTFADAEAQTFTSAEGENVGTAAFAKDKNGTRVAFLNLKSDQFFLLCFDKAARSANLDMTMPLPEKVLTDEEKVLQYLASTPIQKGKEVKIFGALSLKPPDEGHYLCKTVSYRYDGKGSQTDSIGCSDAIGFDLFAGGSYRLQLKDKFEDEESTYKHNPKTGAFVFDGGSLSVYLKRLIPVRKDLDAQFKNISMIYATDYDYEDRLDELIICTFSGPPKTQSPLAVIAARAEKNLHPPEPGSSRFNGLYYSITWSMMFGPNFTSYQVPNYTFRYFQDNGYVWLGDEPADGDFEKLDCTKSMVNDRGDPTCTAYNLSKGLFSKSTLSIGHEQPVSFEQDKDGITTDGTAFSLITPMQDLKLNKSYSYFSYTGIAAVSASIDFTAAGEFQADSSVGISYTTPEIGDTTTTVTGYDEKAPVKGRYTLNGHSLEITSPDGKKSKVFFAQLSDGFFLHEWQGLSGSIEF